MAFQLTPRNRMVNQGLYTKISLVPVSNSKLFTILVLIVWQRGQALCRVCLEMVVHTILMLIEHLTVDYHMQ